MLFYTFNSQEERRAFGGSMFIELQFCKLPVGTKNKKIISVDSIVNWQNDSLYVSNENMFYNEYSHILNCGMYGNLKCGVVDIFGINYYSPSLIDTIIEEIKKNKPLDYETLIGWLNKAKQYNGFYVLGM